ncbi:citrate/2-methylcitrate synthase [Xenophilus aerolatus]|nr:citrate/2-methylcitrate synthase [Xenophilus aerolatus]
MNRDHQLYLSAQAAAAALGVAIPTLYAYVSRGLIRSERVPGSKSRKYWRSDIERLAKGAAASPASARPSALALDTELTLLLDGGLYFRGVNAIELARHATLEEVAALLWRADEWKDGDIGAKSSPAGWAGLLGTQMELSSRDRAIALLPAAERADPRAYDLSRPGYVRTARDVLRWYTAIVTRSRALHATPVHVLLSKALAAPKGMEEVIRTTLVLSADHEFDPVTYAVRAIANTGVTPYMVATTGLIMRHGLRFQSQRFGAVSRFLLEVLSARRGDAPVVARMRHGEDLPGFSAGVGLPDARTEPLMEALRRHLKSDGDLRRLAEAQQCALDTSGRHMDFILPALFVGHKLGLQGEELAVSAIGRLVGWMAHAMEQFFEREYVRPRANYVGALPEASGEGLT